MLFIDARHVFRKIDRAHRDFTEAQIEFVSNIVRLYRGENLEFKYGSEKKWKELFGSVSEFVDVPGLCRAVTRDQIELQEWSLNPGVYVKVEKTKSEGNVEFEDAFQALNDELEVLTTEAHRLEIEISENFNQCLQ